MIQAELFPREQIHAEAFDTNSRGTPSWLIEAVRSVWAFDLDACASAWNAKHENYYSLEKGQNSLELPWARKTWCNPPYSDIRPWTCKAFYEAHNNGAEIIMLLPSRTDTDWFHDLFAAHEARRSVQVKFLACRVNFDYPPGHPGGSSNPERSLLACFNVTAGLADRVVAEIYRSRG